ncbi:hypothetical protein KI387_020792, partial [Taxus chinensis]
MAATLTEKDVLLEKIECLPCEIICEILSWLPFRKVFQVQSVCHSWRNIVCSSQNFHKLWDERNWERWLVGTLEYEGSVYITDGKMEDRFFRKILDSGGWRLRAGAAGGLMLFSKEGRLRVVNPLTLKSCDLPPPVLLLAGDHEEVAPILFFMEGKHDVCVDIHVDSMVSYEVIVLNDEVIGNWDVLIYRSTQRSWQVTIGNGKVPRILHGKWLPSTDEYCNPETKTFLFVREGADSHINLNAGGSECKGYIMRKGRHLILRNGTCSVSADGTLLLSIECPSYGLEGKMIL